MLLLMLLSAISIEHLYNNFHSMDNNDNDIRKYDYVTLG